MARACDHYEDEADDTVKSFADGEDSNRRIKYNEVPDDSTRTTMCQDKAMGMNLGKKTGNLSKIMNLPPKDYDQWNQADFLSNMEEITR